ncbi:MAG: hypothetical protein AAGD92_03920 [Pseudomonadota bacterium]
MTYDEEISASNNKPNRWWDLPISIFMLIWALSLIVATFMTDNTILMAMLWLLFGVSMMMRLRMRKR